MIVRLCFIHVLGIRPLELNIFVNAGWNYCQSCTNKRNDSDQTANRSCCIDYTSKYDIELLNYVLYAVLWLQLDILWIKSCFLKKCHMLYILV